MRATDFETILPDVPLAALPSKLNQTPSRAAPFLLVALAMPAATLSLFPFAMLAEQAIREPAIVVEQAGTTAAVAAAFVLWLAVFAWPISLRLIRAGTSRSIELASARIVTVTDRGLFGTTAWREPVANYAGLLHRVRSSLSGTRHELILVHADPSRTILLRAAPRISTAEIEATATLLGCPEIAQPVVYATFGSPTKPAEKEVLATAA